VHSPIRPKLLHVHVVSHVAAAAERTLWKKRASEIATAAAEHCRRRDAARPRRGTRLLARLSSGPLLARHDPAGSPRACASLRAHAHASDGLQGGGGEHGSSAAEGRLAATDRGTAGNLAASKVLSAAAASARTQARTCAAVMACLVAPPRRRTRAPGQAGASRAGDSKL